MVDERGNNLVFLLCTPRSGSSLATVMLQNHSKLFATQEMWFLLSLLDLKSAQKRAYGGGAILERFYGGVLPEKAFEKAGRAFALQVYNGLLQGSEAEAIIDKSPRYYCLLEFLDTLFPSSKRIWLVRNPFAVLASYKKLGASRGGSSDLAALLGGSAFDIKAADLTIGLLRYAAYFSRPDPNAYRLSYEKLVAAPREQLGGVCRFLGKEYEEGMENYGRRMDTPKNGLYFSMGVGDPNVADHDAPHEDSVHAWKEILTKREIELYGRLLGASLIESLGYGEELAEAEKLAGVRFEAEPDDAWAAYRTRQLAEATGYRWKEYYAIRSEPGEHEPGLPGLDLPEHDIPGGNPAASKTEAQATLPGESADSRELQLRMTIRNLERRLESGLAERQRLRSQLEAMKRKSNWLKAAIPFGARLSRMASSYLAGTGEKK
ncbi:sulfotransferase [Cohnella sp. AR92]|uniref:sulfotransferase n=1 Tax=Cohnella sp. AR92 TaxID=648716 RepID=UPI000F8F769B|nr:sulfotransferase [Cohnella sp. AR92]RUS42656.1 sulfotransferase [Cohnella sp. AR92]